MNDSHYLASLAAAADAFERFGPYVIAILIAAFVVYRTRSLFFLFYRIQGLIGGNQAFHDGRIQRHWQSYEDMHRLNLWFGLRLKNSRSMHQLFAWLDRHKLSVNEVAKTVPYFDTNHLKFSYPSRCEIIWNRIWISLSGTLLIFAANVFVYTDYALLYVNKTHTLFWVNSGHAYSPSFPISSRIAPGHSWHVDSEYCLFSDGTAPLSEKWDQEVICGLVLGNNTEYVENAIQSQRYLSIYLFVIFLAITIPAGLRAYTRGQARKLEKRMTDSPPTTT